MTFEVNSGHFKGKAHAREAGFLKEEEGGGYEELGHSRGSATRLDSPVNDLRGGLQTGNRKIGKQDSAYGGRSQYSKKKKKATPSDEGRM